MQFESRLNKYRFEMNNMVARLGRHPWLPGLSFVSAALVIGANWSGVGWSWDSTDYVAAGLNLAKGRGALDVTGNPMTVRPPGFPALIAVGDWIGLTPNSTLNLINIGSAIIVVVCTYLILSYATPRRTVVVLGTAFVAVGPALLWQYSMAWSEPPFLAVEALAIVVGLLAKSAWKYPILSVLLAGLFFLRYVGPVFSVTIIFVSLIADVRLRGLFRAVAFNFLVLASSLIPAWWWLLRNRRIDGTFTGVRQAGGGTLLDSAKTLPGTLGTWLIGKPFDTVVYLNWSSYPRLAKLTALIFMVLFVLLCGIIIARVLRRHEFPSQVEGLTIAMMFGIVFSYSAFSVYRFVHWELGRFDNRMMIPLYMPLVILIALVIDLGLPRQRTVRLVAVGALVALLGVHTILSITDAWTFGREGRHWSMQWFQDLPIHKYARSLPPESGLFSNAPQQLYANVLVWPIFDPWQLDTVRPLPCRHRYVVWYKSFVVQDNKPERLNVLFDDEWGTVYDLGSCDTDINLIWD